MLSRLLSILLLLKEQSLNWCEISGFILFLLSRPDKAKEINEIVDITLVFLCASCFLESVLANKLFSDSQLVFNESL